MKTQGFGILIKSTACIAGLVFVTGAPTSAFSYTVAEYEASSSLSYSVVGLWGLDGSPISSDALDEGGFNDFEPNITTYSVTDQNGDEVEPSGILEFDYDQTLSVYGRLISDDYNVFLEAIDETSQYERYDSRSTARSGHLRIRLRFECRGVFHQRTGFGVFSGLYRLARDLWHGTHKR